GDDEQQQQQQQRAGCTRTCPSVYVWKRCWSSASGAVWIDYGSVQWSVVGFIIVTISIPTTTTTATTTAAAEIPANAAIESNSSFRIGRQGIKAETRAQGAG